MPHPFDATLKDLVRRYPDDFKQLLGLTTPGRAHVLNVDLSMVSAASDVVLGIGEPLSAVVDLNFQVGRDPALSRRVFGYNALLHYQLDVPVHSVAVLLRREANDRRLTGNLNYFVQSTRGKVDFAFDVVRLWREPVDRFLNGPVGGLPLAVLAQLQVASPRRALPKVLHEIDERVKYELQPPQIADLWAATFVLSGLRLPRQEAVGLFKGILAMKESTTYQYIIEQGMKEGRKRGRKEGREKGRKEGVREIVLLQGEDRFGKPSAAMVKRLRAVDDLERLQRISKNLLHVKSWKELLETP
jgi:predicted transposase YdaD